MIGRIVFITFSFLWFLGSAFIIAPAKNKVFSQSTGVNSSISLTQSITTSVNQSINIPIMIYTDNVEVVGIDIVIYFDRNYLELTDITAYPENSTLKTFIPSNDIGNLDKLEIMQNAKDTGTIEFGALCLLNISCSKGLTGTLGQSNPLARIYFKALREGSTNINTAFTAGSTTDSNLVSRNYQDILGKTANARVTINKTSNTSSSTNPTPTPTQTPSPTTTPTPSKTANNTNNYSLFYASNPDDENSTPTPSSKPKKILGPAGYLKAKEKKAKLNTTVLGEKTEKKSSSSQVITATNLLLVTFIIFFVGGAIIYVRLYIIRNLNKEINKNKPKHPVPDVDITLDLPREKVIKNEEKPQAFSSDTKLPVTEKNNLKSNNNVIFSVPRK